MLVIFFVCYEYIKVMEIKFIKKPLIYTVQSNQGLPDIAKMFEVSVEAIKKLNKTTRVSEGDIIALPQENFYIVQPADTLDKIATKLNLPKHHLMQKNNVRRVFIGQILRY